MSDDRASPNGKATAAGKETPTTWSRRSIEIARRQLNENFIYATIAAGLLLRRELLIVTVLLLLTIAAVLYEAWRSRHGDYEPGGVVAAVAKLIVGLFTTRPFVQRLVAAAAVLAVVGAGIAWMSWTAIDNALADSHMDGDVNVVVATFHDQDAGERRSSGVSRQVSEWLESSLQSEFPAGVGDKTVAVKLVNDVVQGSKEEGEAKALSLGRQYAANVVLYGEVLQRNDGSIFVTPKFTFTSRENADLTAGEVAELVGADALGDEIGPIDLKNSSVVLSGRSQVIVQFLTGLVSLLRHEPAAADEFRAVIKVGDEQGLSQNAVLQYFLGSALLIEHTPEGYDAATQAFNSALTIRPDYVRAEIGLANAYYLQATRAVPEDESLLRQAAYIYQGALGGAAQAEGPALEARARIGLGNTYLLLARGDDVERYKSEARREYEAVLALSDACGGGPGWWNPRRYLPWSDNSDPAYCDQLSRLTRLAETIVANFDVLHGSEAAPATAAPPGTARVAIDSVTVAVGQIGSARVRAVYQNEPGLGAWALSVMYDPALLSAEECSSSHGGVCNAHYDDVTIRIAGASGPGLTPGEQALAELKFTCTKVGRSPLDLRLDVLADATVGGPRPIDATVESGVVTCLP